MSTRCELTLQHTGCADGTRSSHPWEGERGHGSIYAHMSTPRWLCINTRVYPRSLHLETCPAWHVSLQAEKHHHPGSCIRICFAFLSRVLELLLVCKNSTTGGSLPDRWNSFPLRRNWWKSPLETFLTLPENVQWE